MKQQTQSPRLLIAASCPTGRCSPAPPLRPAFRRALFTTSGWWRTISPCRRSCPGSGTMAHGLRRLAIFHLPPATADVFCQHARATANVCTLEATLVTYNCLSARSQAAREMLDLGLHKHACALAGQQEARCQEDGVSSTETHRVLTGVSSGWLSGRPGATVMDRLCSPTGAAFPFATRNPAY